jgi:ribosomal protein L33
MTVENSQGMAIGLECKDCGCRHFIVVHTKKMNQRIIRYRRCRYCGKRIITSERILA